MQEGEEVEPGPSVIAADHAGIIPAIYTEDPQQEPQPEKIHIRGLGDFSEDDILTFAQENFQTEEPPRIQWIDDTSANLIYPSRDVALQAILAFTSEPTTANEIHNAPLQLRSAKSLSRRPLVPLEVRIAVVGDRKKKGARHESRYYLFHPEVDPGEYKRRRFDQREFTRRRDQDRNDDPSDHFTASMYDDAPTTDGGAQDGPRKRAPRADLFDRIERPTGRLGRRRSASPGRKRSRNSDEIDIHDSSDEADRRQQPRRKNGYRDRSVGTTLPPYSLKDPNPTPKENQGKELFTSAQPTPRANPFQPPSKVPSQTTELFPTRSSATNGRLTETDTEVSMQQAPASLGRSSSNAYAARRLKSDLLAASASTSHSKAQTSPSRARHQRSNALDAKTEEDLSNYARQSLSIDSTKSTGFNTGRELFGPALNSSNGFSIKGSANHSDQGLQIKGSGGLSIKGRAAGATKEEVRELFPGQYDKKNGKPEIPSARNQGKELFAFDEAIRERRTRARAGDLFGD